jgi:TPR repeat protein
MKDEYLPLAQQAVARGDIAAVEAILADELAAGDAESREFLGTALTILSPERRIEAIRLLEAAAAAGRGLAAHNLAVLYRTGAAPDLELSDRYFQMALDLGFEQTVASDPLWWKR